MSTAQHTPGPLTQSQTEALDMLRKAGSDSGWTIPGKASVLRSLERRGLAESSLVGYDKVTPSGGYVRGWKTVYRAAIAKATGSAA